jgi:hypothetical protein
VALKATTGPPDRYFQHRLPDKPPIATKVIDDEVDVSSSLFGDRRRPACFRHTQLPQRNNDRSAGPFVPELPSLSAVDGRNGIPHNRFCKKCARGARLLAISRGRDRAFFCNHSSSGVASAGPKDEDGTISDILPGAHCTIDVDGRPTINGLRRREKSSANNGCATIVASL